MPKEKKKAIDKVFREINPLINSQTDTPSMGSWPVSPAPIVDDVDRIKESNKDDHKHRLP